MELRKRLGNGNGHQKYKELGSENVAGKSISERYCNYLESFAWMISVLFVFYYYNFIGELARMRGIDYNEYLLTKWDMQIPNVSFMIVPYVGVYGLVWVYWLAAVTTAPTKLSYKWDLGKLRRGWGVHILLIFAGYIIFYLVPVHIEPLGNYEPGPRWIDKLAFQIVHRGMTRFAAFPSMHVANAWFCVWLHKSQNLPGIWIARILAYFQIVDTVFVRAHYMLDIPAGWLLAEFFGRFVLAPIEKRKWFNSERPLPVVVIFFLPVFLFIHPSFILGVTGGVYKARERIHRGVLIRDY